MNQKTFETQLLFWMQTFVEVPNIKLNNWAPCPFARTARLKNQIKMVWSSNLDEIKSLLANESELFNKFEVVAFGLPAVTISPKELSSEIDVLNEKLSEKDIFLLEDHPDELEILNGVVMNFGKSIVIFAQRKSKLNSASKQLYDKGYYANWPKENLDYVLKNRNEILQN